MPAKRRSTAEDVEKVARNESHADTVDPIVRPNGCGGSASEREEGATPRRVILARTRGLVQ
jgi:hypothetical protein